MDESTYQRLMREAKAEFDAWDRAPRSAFVAGFSRKLQEAQPDSGRTKRKQRKAG